MYNNIQNDFLMANIMKLAYAIFIASQSTLDYSSGLPLSVFSPLHLLKFGSFILLLIFLFSVYLAVHS